jgi:hypothetical protein
MWEEIMNHSIHVELGPAGVPVAYVPASSLWDLVEFLSYQRVSVTYRFEETHFAVVFPKSDLATAERLLADWVHFGDKVMQYT